MNRLKALVRRFRALSPAVRFTLLALLAALLVGGPTAWYLNADSAYEKPAAVAAFEADPDAWLSHQTTPDVLRDALAAGQVEAIGLPGATRGLVLFTLADGTRGATRAPGCGELSCAGTLIDSLEPRSAADGFALVHVDIDTRSAGEKAADIARPLVPIAGLLVVMGVLLFVVSRMQSRGSDAATLSERPATRFDEVIGNDEAKAALARVGAFMRDPRRYTEVGARAPHGVLLVGPPGTGKTLLARALAGETGANFIAVDGSYFTSMFYGMGVTKVQTLFRQARRHAPCVLFIDEIDGIGKRNTSGDMRGGEAEMNRIINRVLVEMDGFAAMDNVVVVAATNNEENLDPAMRRAGRFDTTVRVALPTLPERAALFDLYLAGVKAAPGIDTAVLARMTSGVSPADVANLVNKAASKAAETGAASVDAEHLMQAIEAHTLGGEVSARKNLLTEETRRRIAWHEAGHALVGHALSAGRVERVTIEPRGQALGVTYMTRETEDPLYGEDEMRNRLAMMLGGREAELAVFGNVSSGASDDLKRASELAVSMVGTLGFSRTFGLLSVTGVPRELLGPDVQAAVLDEARLLLDESQRRCRRVLDEQRARLDALARELLVSEVVSGDALRALLEGPLRSPQGRAAESAGKARLAA